MDREHNFEDASILHFLRFNGLREELNSIFGTKAFLLRLTLNLNIKPFPSCTRN